MRKYVIVFALLVFWMAGTITPPTTASGKPWNDKSPGEWVRNPPAPCDVPPIN